MHALGAQRGDGAIHRMALGDAAQVEGERDVGADPSPGVEMQRVHPSSVRAVARGRGGQQPVARKQGRYGDVECAAGLLPQCLRQAEHSECLGIDDDSALMCIAGDTREVAAGIVRAHRPVHMRNRGECGRKMCVAGHACRQGDFDQRSQPYLGARDPAVRSGQGWH